MKRLLTFILCSALALGSLSFSAGAAETTITDTSAAVDSADTSADVMTADTGADKEVAAVGATADEVAATGYSLLTEAQFQSKMAAMRSKYPDGSIWEGLYYESGSVKATTCWAYAAQMLREFFGVNFYADGMLNYKYYDTSGICAGDWVRIDWDSHSIFITKVTAKGVYFTDGNGTGVYNQVRWDGFYSWSEINSRFSYRLHVPGNNLRGDADEIKHTIAYNANGGSGSMSSKSLSAGTGFSLDKSGFTRSGYSFAGYIVKRSSDNTYYTTDAGWATQTDIQTKGYHYRIYQPGGSYTMGTPWLGTTTNSTTFTFYAQWLPDTVTIEYAANYSGYNYILGSDLGKNYSDYIFSRDASVYTLSVDTTERLNNADSLKIVGSTAGKSGADLAFNTSTNKGYGSGYSQAGAAGDEKNLVLHFYAKSSVDGAKMYLRWGFNSEYKTISLTKSWKVYSVELPKNRFYSTAIHPYFDKAGTYYLNSLALGDASGTTNVVPETGGWITTQNVPRGESIEKLPSPTREGYVFLGWYTAAEGGNRITEESIINESTLRLYAHWRKQISYIPVKTVQHNGHIYELYDNSLGWDDASRFCLSRGGHLIDISDAAENEIALDMIRDRQGYCWTGLHYNTSSKQWIWTDGTALSDYNAWYKPEFGTKDTKEYFGLLYPMNIGTTAFQGTWDKCVGSNYYSSYYGYYNSFFICEYDDPDFRGDTDGNGTIELYDVTMIQRYNAKVDNDVDDGIMKRGDINADGTLGITDATFIQRHIAAMETPYSVGEWIK